MIRIAGELGVALRPDDRVLDFGCGIGEAVEILAARGIDAYGVDVAEWWGKDYGAYWQNTPPPPPEIVARLRSVDEHRYALPFPDRWFRLVLSWATFEHVFDYEAAFREIARILAPGGIAVNVFPGLGSPVEPHLDIPVVALCRYGWWLDLWALRRGAGAGWRERRQSLRASMRLNNYPTRAELRRHAAAAGVQLEFHEGLYIELSDSRPNRLVRRARKIGLGWAASAVAERICQRTMVLRRAGD
jgi:SAM-dependent methyltransferase